MEIITIETSSLGDRSYVLVDGDAAAVIDPQRDIDRVLATLDDRRLRLSHVFETHVHNDYVTGGLELARLTGAAYVVAAAADVAFERTGASDGEEFIVGGMHRKEGRRSVTQGRPAPARWATGDQGRRRWRPSGRARGSRPC